MYRYSNSNILHWAGKLLGDKNIERQQWGIKVYLQLEKPQQTPLRYGQSR